MTKAVLVAFHQYTPFGDEFYRPIFDRFIKGYREIWGKEVDKLYILASNWNVDIADDYTVIQTDPALRYYDAYKSVLKSGRIHEDLVMFMDNDMIVYKKGLVEKTFDLLVGDSPSWDYDFQIKEPYDLVSIYDTIGTMQVDLPDGKNKFCPYWFAAPKEILMKYLDVDWSPDAMPYTETLGLLTEAMLKDGLIPYEWEEDKSNILFDGIQDGEKGKDLGYYHVRAGSTPAYLLATHKYGDAKTYWDYLHNQPRNELVRQCAWYEYMMDDISPSLLLMLLDMHISAEDFYMYYNKFKVYHGLK